MINKNGVLKLADFGLARAFGIPVKNFTHEVVTLWYRAPDILLGSKNYSTSVDIWSVGCIFAEMLTKKALFMGNDECEQLKQIIRLMGMPSSEEWPSVETLPLWNDFKHVCLDKNIPAPVPLEVLVPGLDEVGLDLLSRMLQCNPARRITAKQAMQHPYLADVPEHIRSMK